VAATVRSTDDSIPLFPGCSKRAFPPLHVAANTALNREQHYAHHGDHTPDVHQHQQVTTAGLSSQHSTGDSQGHPRQDTCDEDHLWTEGACSDDYGGTRVPAAIYPTDREGEANGRLELVDFDCCHEITVYGYPLWKRYVYSVE
jgi:hypothetical protein